MGDVRTVTVGSDDWVSWREIRLRSLRQDPAAFGSTHEREAAFTEQTWRSRLDGTSGPSVLAYAGDEVVGIGAGWLHGPGRLMVVAMWTEPDRRGQGVGRQVLDHLIGWARERDLRVDLWVADANPDARRLYERYGFHADGRNEPIREGAEATMSHLVLSD
ncbi:GNAT family N-acetyltransferase [Plantactinospora mayteni]|uniref:N-acetyltransferase n=1 Tax=Plantactinospora mayteni TaxID=566021 RepID=A0ABQ4EN34_9ACTN|nr:GNAT family N-acetyltransferase [Plantactinospora mayteni]GIG96082.1 N-acetyltransferase [Plantactinospora mayteni]